MNKKIVTLEKLKNISKTTKLKGKKIIHCHGVFDLLHIGHIKHFAEAKTIGDVLIVTLTPDKLVNKGPNRPAFKIDHRLEAIAALENVDYVSENKWATAEKTIELIKPNFYFKGPDYKINKKDITGNIKREISAVKKSGGCIRYSKDVTFSSSTLLNKYSDIYSSKQKNFMKSITKKLYEADMNNFIDNSFNDLKVLVIGETIIDEYVFCEALGKSGKEPMLVLRELEAEKYLGGASAIANHLSSFVKKVDLLSCLGHDKQYEEFTLKNLSSNIKTKFIYKEKSPTIIKKRFIDKNSKSKTLGVYSLNDDNLSKKQENSVISYLNKSNKYDLIIVADYGHGFITEKIAKVISNKKIFLSLNAQINSSNSGFHSIKKYPNCNSIIINESELRHELRSREGNLNELMKILSVNLKADFVVVTRGTEGSTIYNKKKDLYTSCPAFASKVVDKVGSGDALLPIISISLAKKMDDDISLFLGSLAAAQSVETISNSKSVNKIEIVKTLQHAIK